MASRPAQRRREPLLRPPPDRSAARAAPFRAPFSRGTPPMVVRERHDGVVKGRLPTLMPVGLPAAALSARFREGVPARY
jgi:hypothetical protein